MPHVIQTERLSLFLIEPAELIALYEDPTNEWIYDKKSFTNPYGVLVKNSGPLQWRVPQIKKDQNLNRWFVRWIVLKETQEIIGSISFHGKPNEEGMIEIGLGIEDQFQKKGYATEALLGMWLWVIGEPDVEILRYTVSATNGPSVAIIKKFGFTHIGQQMDEADGPEEIYEMTAEVFRKKYFKDNEKS